MPNLTNDQVLTMYFQSCLNIPYKWGGNNPIQGYDCSGFVQEALATINLDPIGDQTSHSLYDIFKHSTEGTLVKKANFGHLLFFGERKKIRHVAIALNAHTMIEAGGGGSRVTSHNDAIEHNAFVRIRPILRRNDLVAIIKIY